MNDPDEQLAYCRRILPRVSRTFALGIELLNQPLRETVTVAYLICRILDTVEDTTALPSGERAALLERAGRELPDPELWRNCCRTIGDALPEEDFPGDEPDLCRRAGLVLEVYHRFPPAVRAAIAGPVGEMAAGMAGTVRRESAPGGLRLETIKDLEEYCYYVAGTVGVMLTSLFRLDRPAVTAAVKDKLRPAGVDFGLGLQLTNIIKDVADDSSRGVSYLPRGLLEDAGITLEGAVEDPADPRARKVAQRLVRLALPRLDRGLEYTLDIPAGESDLRLFCALPLFFAIRTLGMAADVSRVFGREPLKISRGEVAEIHRRLKKIAGDNGELRAEYNREKERSGF